MPSRASALGGPMGTICPSRSSAPSTCFSASSLSWICVCPCTRLTFRLTVRLPRVTRLPTVSRMRGSRPSKPGGTRSLISRPRPFTERTSQCQLKLPIAPSARAKPVMLLMVMVSVHRLWMPKQERCRWHALLYTNPIRVLKSSRSAHVQQGEGGKAIRSTWRFGWVVGAPTLAVLVASRCCALARIRLRSLALFGWSADDSPRLRLSRCRRISRRRRRHRLGLQLLLYSAPLLHVRVMVLESFRKNVAAGAVCDEITGLWYLPG